MYFTYAYVIPHQTTSFIIPEVSFFNTYIQPAWTFGDKKQIGRLFMLIYKSSVTI